MPSKPIKPSGTAKDRVPQQADNMPPAISSELERMRAEQQKHISATETVNVGVDQLVDHFAPSEEVAADAGDIFTAGLVTSFVIEMGDGRELELGPPPLPHALIIPKMFADRTDLNPIQTEGEIKLARVMLYVRRVGNQRMQLLRTWKEVVKLAEELGEMGVRACYEVYAENWSDYSPSGWRFVKKSVSSKSFGTTSP